MEPRFESVHLTEREQSLTGFEANIETGQIPDAIIAAHALAARYRDEAARKISRADEIEALAGELTNYLPGVSDKQLAALLQIESNGGKDI